MPSDWRDAEGGTASLFSEAAAALGRLVKGELMLARAEAAGALRAAAAGVAKIALAGLLALVGMNMLAGAAVAGLVQAGLGPAWSGLVVGLVLCGLGLGLALAGRSALRLQGIWPARSLRGLRRDVAALRAGVGEKEVRHV